MNRAMEATETVMNTRQLDEEIERDLERLENVINAYARVSDGLRTVIESTPGLALQFGYENIGTAIPLEMLRTVAGEVAVLQMQSNRLATERDKRLANLS